MRFFLDENFPMSATEILETDGHQVFDIRNTEFEGSDDQLIFELAQRKKAIFLTTDKDFFHTIPSLYKTHYGVIVIALRRPNRQKIIKKLLFVLTKIDLTKADSKVIFLKDNKYYIR